MDIAGKIYVIRNSENGKGYIGQTITTLFKRLSEHRYLSKRGSMSVLHKAMRKWGEDKFGISLVVACDVDCLDDLEKHYIKTMNTHAVRGHGYNLTDGGQGSSYDNRGRLISEDGKRKLSEIHKGNSYAKGHEVSPEARLEMSRAQIGRIYSSPSAEIRERISSTLKGHSVSAETRAKISLANKGKKRERPIAPRPPHTEEAKAKIGKFQRGKPKSPESMLKMIETKRAKPNGFGMTEEAKKKISAKLSGRKLSESHRAAMSVAQRKRSEKNKANFDSAGDQRFQHAGS